MVIPPPLEVRRGGSYHGRSSGRRAILATRRTTSGYSVPNLNRCRSATTYRAGPPAAGVLSRTATALGSDAWPRSTDRMYDGPPYSPRVASLIEIPPLEQRPAIAPERPVDRLRAEDLVPRLFPRTFVLLPIAALAQRP